MKFEIDGNCSLSIEDKEEIHSLSWVHGPVNKQHT